MSAYTRLEQRFKRLNALREAAGLLQWDMSTMMPAGGAEARGEQLAALEVTCHELPSAPETAALPAAAEGRAARSSELLAWDRRKSAVYVARSGRDGAKGG